MARFHLTQASNWQRTEYIEIETLEQLLAFAEEHGDLVIRKERDYKDLVDLDSFEIVIYDTYME